MSDKLPAQFDPARLAARGAEFQGQVPQAAFPRLAEAVVAVQGEVTIDLHFKAITGRYAGVEGRLRTDLVLECQRCLSAMTYPVDDVFKLVFVVSEAEAEDLPDDYEPVVCPENTLLSVADLLEDELLLQLPLVANHQDGDDCQADLVYKASPNRNTPGVEGGKPNPFAVLKDLTHKH